MPSLLAPLIALSDFCENKWQPTEVLKWFVGALELGSYLIWNTENKTSLNQKPLCSLVIPFPKWFLFETGCIWDSLYTSSTSTSSVLGLKFPKGYPHLQIQFHKPRLESNCYVAKNDHKPLIFLPLPPNCWNYWQVPQCLFIFQWYLESHSGLGTCWASTLLR